MDGFTFASFAPECRLMQLTPRNSVQELNEFKPDFIFIESAWRGGNDLWQGKIISGVDITKILFWGRTHNIPVVFWNKEDPVHFNYFLPLARLCDYVFTTDADLISQYRTHLGHQRVFLLPFAAQPEYHNPMEQGVRKDAFCFAGSYYMQHSERRRDFSRLFDVLIKHKEIVIYDRNYMNNDEINYIFPEKYQSCIVGGLPVEQIATAYKGYLYNINLNTVKQSSTMCARRVYELLASNTIVISNFSRAIRLFFGDLVLASDNPDEIMRRIHQLESNQQNMNKFRLAGLRQLMRCNIYQDRLATIVSKLQSYPLSYTLPKIIVLSYVANEQEQEQIIAHFKRQTYRSCRLLLITSLPFAPTENISYLSEFVAADLMLEQVALQDDWLAVFVPQDYYGPNYLLDLALATRYSSAKAFGKAAYYTNMSSTLNLMHPEARYTNVSFLLLRRMLVNKSVIKDITLVDLLHHRDSLRFEPMLAIDEFNYCENAGAHFSAAQKLLVNDLPRNETNYWEQTTTDEHQSHNSDSPLISTSEYLLLATYYPAYDQLHQDHFLHQCAQAYKARQLSLEVFQFSVDDNLKFREFQGIDVVEGGPSHLEWMLQLGQHKTILVYFLNETMWSVLRIYASRLNIFIWVEERDIQSWIENEEARRFWQQLIERMPEKVHLIFPSSALVNTAMAHLNLSFKKETYSVIQNSMEDCPRYKWSESIG